MTSNRRQHPGEPGTRACWAAGCVQYECVIAADIDPVAVERHLRGERHPRGERFGRAMLTGDENEEVLRRQAGANTSIPDDRARLHSGHAAVRQRRSRQVW